MILRRWTGFWSGIELIMIQLIRFLQVHHFSNEKNMMVKNEVVSGRLFQSVYRVDSNSNLDKILQIVLPIFLQLVCEWILKKYRVENDTKKMDWILKWYRVDNVYKSSYCNNVWSAFFPVLLSLLETPFSQRDENDPVDSFPTSAFVDTIKLKGILNQYRVNNYGETAYDESILCKHNGCQVLLFRSTHRMMRSNDIHFSHGSTYDDVYCDGCNNLDTSDRFGKDIDVQVVKNNNLFSDYDDDNNNRKPINNSSCLMPDQLDHLDSISLMPDLHSNK